MRAGARRLVRALRDPSSIPLWIAAVAALAVAVPFVAFGGLDPATRAPLPRGTGDAVRTSLYEVTVLHAELTDKIEEQYLSADDGEDLLVVTAVIENLSDVPVGIVQTVDRVRSRLAGSSTPLIDLVGVEATSGPSAWRDESVAAVVLQPRVPAEVRIAWPVPEGSFPDGSVAIDVYDAVAQGGQVILSSSAITWQRTEPAARVTVRVDP